MTTLPLEKSANSFPQSLWDHRWLGIVLTVGVAAVIGAISETWRSQSSHHDTRLQC